MLHIGLCVKHSVYTVYTAIPIGVFVHSVMGRGQNSTKLTGCTSGCSFHCIAMHCLGVLCRLKGAGGTTAEQCCTTLTGCTLYTVHRYVVHMTLRILGWVVSI